MRKSVLGAVVAAGAVLGAVSGCTSAVPGSGQSDGQQQVALAADLSFQGGSDAAMAMPLMDKQPTAYTFQTVDDNADPTFNQSLGVNDEGVIAGYFGSGAAGHPNKGYQVTNRARTFVAENFPGSTQTQVTGLNNRGMTVGFYSAANNANQVNDNTGFVQDKGTFRRVAFPTTSNANPPVNQLLGVNDDDAAVGFYTDAAGNNHGYRYDVEHSSFTAIAVTGSTSVTAAAINDRNQIAGFDTTSAGATEGFLRDNDGRTTRLAFPGASMTQALGLSNRGEVVGVYQVGGGATHGFTWTAKGGFKTVDDPNGVGATTVNGVNDTGVLAGFYVDGAGNTHGMLAKPGGTNPTPPTTGTTTTKPTPTGTPQPTSHLTLAAMPSGTVAVRPTGDHHFHAQIKAFGFTPGSPHLVEIDAPGAAGPVVRFGAVTADAGGRIDTAIDSVDTDAALPPRAQFVIRLGANTGDFNRNAVAGEVIARSAALPARPDGDATALTAVDQNTAGNDLGALSGTATVTYDPNAHTVAVTLNATGLTPGKHAVHIHTGSCQAQGGVLTMLPDFTADGYGRIVNQTNTATGVTSMPATGTWYLNLHLGDMASILTAAGQPALSFRPLLCANG